MKIQYVADDGKIFNNRWDCEKYEEENKIQQERENTIAVYSDSMSELSDFYVRYFDGKDFVEEKDFPSNCDDLTTERIRSFISKIQLWLQHDIAQAVIRNEGITVDEIISEIKCWEHGDVILRGIEIKKVKSKIEVCSDWETALKMCKRSTELSSKVMYCFSERDLKILAVLHKENKFRSKIESLLTDCNYHKESADFRNRKYDGYIA